MFPPADPTTDQDDKFHEECGVFAVWRHPDAAALTALGLHALQHRGQEACGIITHDPANHLRKFHMHRALGLVGDNFNKPNVIATLPGTSAIGHNRYATTGETALRNVQPLYADFDFGGFALAHNGNLTNALTLRKELVQAGALFQSSSDTETIIQLMARSKGEVPERLIAALQGVQGAYSIVALHAGGIIGVRDPNGVRPLVLGMLNDTYIMASETCALDIVGATYLRDIEPGEMVTISEAGLQSFKPFRPRASRFCIFEYVYFARPDTQLEGQSVYNTRKQIGVVLAAEAPVDADVIVPVPDSGVPAALGFAQAAGIPFEYGIIRNHYVGRTFIEPTSQIRHLGVKLKHNANPIIINGKRVVLVDDSIVRGTTSRKIVDMVRAAGATEVHMRITAPPIKHSCYYGIDTPEEFDLLAHKMSVAEMTEYLNLDSLAFISLDGLHRAVTGVRRDIVTMRHCDACFSGDYAIPLVDRDVTNASETQLRAAHG